MTAPRPSDGGSASAISWPDCTGSALLFWSMRRLSAGCCRLQLSDCRPGWRLFSALGAPPARLFWMRGAMRILALGVALTVTEWLRGHLLTGFPWNALRLRAHFATGVGANRIGHRHLGPDLHRGLCFRQPGDAHRRSLGNPSALAAACAQVACTRRARRFWCLTACPHADAACRQGSSAHHAAELAARRAI